ncbi:MAG: hypothetical protein MJZ36_07800 [Bacteroidaceae bacterium]|nr:hypothetical protein [Bacteroidaceae bacterium]
MKKLSFLALLLLVSMSSMAQWGRMRTPKEPAKNYELKIGKMTMVIDAANGARIMSLKYDTTEVISQNPAPNMYGSTFWTSPQKEWNWPPVREHDMARYTVEQKDGKIIMTSPLSEKIPLRIRKAFSTDKKEGSIVITYTIINEGTIDRSVAPWEVTRVPGEGTVIFEAPADSVWPAGLMAFKQDGKNSKYTIDSSENQRKINANGTGWLRYENKGLQLLKLFPDLKAGQAAPGEDEIQLYVHQGKLYCELEEQGAYTLLHPGESLNWTVRWILKPIGK